MVRSLHRNRGKNLRSRHDSSRDVHAIYALRTLLSSLTPLSSLQRQSLVLYFHGNARKMWKKIADVSFNLSRDGSERFSLLETHTSDMQGIWAGFKTINHVRSMESVKTHTNNAQGVVHLLNLRERVVSTGVTVRSGAARPNNRCSHAAPVRTPHGAHRLSVCLSE
jgi:hypothetical protein